MLRSDEDMDLGRNVSILFGAKQLYATFATFAMFAVFVVFVVFVAFVAFTVFSRTRDAHRKTDQYEMSISESAFPSNELAARLRRRFRPHTAFQAFQVFQTFHFFHSFQSFQKRAVCF